MKCLDCDKVFQYPVIGRELKKALCPMCFGSNLTDVSQEMLDFARAQRWVFDEPKPVEIRVTMVVVPDSVHEQEWWLGYVLHVGGKFNLVPIGTEAAVDRILEDLKLSGGMMKRPLRMDVPDKMYEEVQVYFAVKLQAAEAFRIVPMASEVIELDTINVTTRFSV